MRVFIAGPYSAGHPREVLSNVNKAIEYGIWLMLAGYDVFIPHLSHYIHLHPSCPFEYEEYLKNDMAWLEVSDAVMRLSGHSNGADGEVARAKVLGIPVVYSLEELQDVQLP